MWRDLELLGHIFMEAVWLFGRGHDGDDLIGGEVLAVALFELPTGSLLLSTLLLELLLSSAFSIVSSLRFPLTS